MDLVAFQLLFSSNWRQGNELSTATCRRTFYLATGHPRDIDKLTTLSEPYSWRVWVAVCLSLSATYAIFLVMHRVAITRDNSRGTHAFSLFSLVVGVMVCEGIPHHYFKLAGRSISKQLLVGVWIPSSCLLGMAYQSTLLSMLVKTSKERPINSYQGRISLKKRPLFADS